MALLIANGAFEYKAADLGLRLCLLGLAILSCRALLPGAADTIRKINTRRTGDGTMQGSNAALQVSLGEVR